MLLLDTDIASAFAKAGHFKLLLRLFERPGITPAVYEELLPPLEHGYNYPRDIFESVELVTLTDEEQRAYLKLRSSGLRLGKGELESICACLNRDFLFSSLDKRALVEARDRGVKIVTAGAIFQGLLVRGIVTKEEILSVVRAIELADNRILDINNFLPKT